MMNIPSASQTFCNTINTLTIFTPRKKLFLANLSLPQVLWVHRWLEKGRSSTRRLYFPLLVILLKMIYSCSRGVTITFFQFCFFSPTQTQLNVEFRQISLWLIAIGSIQAFVQDVQYGVGLINQHPVLVHWTAGELRDGSRGLWSPHRCNEMEYNVHLFDCHKRNVFISTPCVCIHFHAYLILMSAVCRARARLMNCNVIDVIHWSAQRVWRMSPVEPAGVSAVTVHHPGVHAVTSAQRAPQPRDADVNGGVDTNGTIIGTASSARQRADPADPADQGR